MVELGVKYHWCLLGGDCRSLLAEILEFYQLATLSAEAEGY